MGIAYRPEIDGLRAIAVLAVVAYHAGLGGAGFVGVDVFFVISGYLITSLLLKERRIDLLAFYARRVRRIFPAAAVVVLAVLATSSLILPLAQQAHTANSAGAALVFGANVFFQFTSGGYFDGAAEEMPLLHLWSLSVEEQFYFFWPALLMVVPRRWLRGVMAGLAVLSLALAEWWIPSDAAFYQMPARFWELAAGGLIAAMPEKAMPRWLLPAGIVATLAACAIPFGHFPGIGALPAVLGASAIIASVHGGGTNVLLASRPVVGVGLISYSLYLWHWPLLAFYEAAAIGQGDIRVRLVLCAVAVLLAIASYRYVEQPFRRLRAPSGRTVAVGATLSLALCACAIGVRPDLPPSLQPARTCHSRGDEPPVPKCEPAESVVWGDSMAYAWSPIAATSFTRDACPPLLGYDTGKPRESPACIAYNATAATQAATADTVYLAARWLSYDDMESSLRRTLDALPGRVVIIGPTPEMRDDVPECIRQHAEALCAITRAEFDAIAQPALAKLREAAAGRPNVEVLDMTDRFCTATTCPPTLDGMPLYWDTHHVSTPKVRLFITRS